jgi:hypothetical protein
MIRSFLFIIGLFLTVTAKGAIVSVENGDFGKVSNGKPAAWDASGQWRVIENGGVDGKPAVELTCDGAGNTSSLTQVVRPTSELVGSVRISAWMKCIGVEDGGDCSVWLDTLLEDGGAIWGKQGIPERANSGWQKVSAIVTYDKPIKEVKVFLLLRNVKGKVLFSDVRIDDTPLEIKKLLVLKADDATYDVQGILTSKANWTLTAKHGSKEVHAKTGNSQYLAERFTVDAGASVDSVVLTAEHNGKSFSMVTEPVSHGIPGPLAWWTTDALTRVFQDDLPPLPQEKQTSIHAARNDRESFQICLKPLNKPLKNVRVSIADLKSADGVIASGNVDWFRVGYVWVGQPFEHPLSPRKSAAWWPDPLLPALPSFEMEAATTQPLWFTVHVPKDAAPGSYEGNVTIEADGIDTVVVPVSLTVHPATIPDEGGMKTAFALMDCYMRKLYGTYTPELRRSYTDYLLAHHLNPDDISRSETPDVDELEYANKRGLNAFNVLNAVEEHKDPHSWCCFSPVEAYTPEFTRRFLERMEPAMAELEKRGLANKAYVYGFDERGPEFLPVIRDLFKAIKTKYPKVRTLSTAWLPEKANPLDYNIDWYVPLTSMYDHQLASDVRKRGGEVWWYICMGPNYPHANWLLENPIIESRVIWWQAYQHNVEGFLYWGLNVWRLNQNDTIIPDRTGPRVNWSVTAGGQHPSLNGDGIMLYPGEKGPIGSTRLEVIRDGLEEFELLKQYGARFGADATTEILAPVTQGMTRYSRDSKTLNAARLKMLTSLQ